MKMVILMIDFENIKITIVKGLKEFLKIPVIRSSQNALPPRYPYISYTITCFLGENKGTWGVYNDEVERFLTVQKWSFTMLSNNYNECLLLANKAKNWFENIGILYLSDKNIIVQSVGQINNRDNIITVDYEYRNGFDVVFYLFDEIKKDIETIETVEF